MAKAENWQIALAEMGPLEAQLDAALASGDVKSALGIAFGAASRAASLVSEPSWTSNMAALQGVLVELAPSPLDTFEDGTLAENGAYVTLTYQSWDITPAQAESMADEWANVTGWTVDSS